MINLVGGMVLLTLTCLSGLVAYAKYYDCDVLSSNQISRSEQVCLQYLSSKIIKIEDSFNLQRISLKRSLAFALFGNGHLGRLARSTRLVCGHYIQCCLVNNQCWNELFSCSMHHWLLQTRLFIDQKETNRRDYCRMDYKGSWLVEAYWITWKIIVKQL